MRLGAVEAQQTAKLFGGNVLLFEEPAVGAAEGAAQKLLSERKVAVLIGSRAEDADALSRFAESHRVIFMNVASRAASLRVSCRRYTFHIEASTSAYATAARELIGSAARSAPVLWADVLEKYGASQINDRYRTRYHLPMDPGAWAGWFAVKAASETALRTRGPRADAMLAYLESPSTSFDGHKGWPLSFRPSDHQLRQPLYMVAPPATVGAQASRVREIPELRMLAASGSGANSASKLLDALIPDSGSCAWSTRK